MALQTFYKSIINEESSNKKFIYFEDNTLITIDFHFDEDRFKKLKQFILSNYSYEKISKIMNVKSYIPKANETIIAKRMVPVRRGLRKEYIEYFDIEKKEIIEPSLLKVMEFIGKKKFLNLITLNNYMIRYTNDGERMHTYHLPLEYVSSAVNVYGDPNYPLNNKENEFSLLDLDDKKIELEKLKQVIIEFFNCMIIDNVKKENVIDNKILIDCDADINKLLYFKEVIELAKSNSTILGKEIFKETKQKII